MGRSARVAFGWVGGLGSGGMRLGGAIVQGIAGRNQLACPAPVHFHVVRGSAEGVGCVLRLPPPLLLLQSGRCHVCHAVQLDAVQQRGCGAGLVPGCSIPTTGEAATQSCSFPCCQ